MLAAIAPAVVERELRDAALVDPDRWQGEASTYPADEPLVERATLCERARADNIARPVWDAGIRSRV